MRSLNLLNKRTLQIGDFSSKLAFIKFTVNNETNTLYALALDQEQSHFVVYSADDHQSFSEMDTIPINPDAILNGDPIVSFHYLSEKESLCIIFAYGDCILYRLNSNSEEEEKVECLGVVESGILAAAWSPDESLLVLITGGDSILYMTHEFDVVKELTLYPETWGVDQQFNVGWGNKETQFHGSEGKLAALTKPEEDVHLSKDDDMKVRVSWRGDGAFFCVSSVGKDGGHRMLHFYDRDALLQSTSEPVNMLEHTLCWRPAGNLIACTQKLPQRHEVVFFQRNGLRHGQFTIRLPENHRIKQLDYNCDSTILAIRLESTENPQISELQLWTMNNYHYYLKQTILSKSVSTKIIDLKWDTESPTLLHTVTSGQTYESFRFTWDIYKSTSLSSLDSGLVAVIDGVDVLLTPFKFMNVPPPMSSYKIHLTSPALCVAFSPDNGNDIAILEENNIHIFNLVFSSNGKPTRYNKLVSIRIPNSVESNISYSFRQLNWISSNSFILVEHARVEDRFVDQLVLVSFPLGSTEEPDFFPIVEKKEVNGGVFRLYYNAAYADIIVVSNNKEVTQVSADGLIEFSPFQEGFKLPSLCPWIATTRTGELKELSLLSLSEKNKLYIHDRVLSGECTSFCIDRNFIMFTTLQHTIRFLPLSMNLEEAAKRDISSLPFDESVRRVERGSRIIVACGISLILQMPRGNLETICPRALVLWVIRQHLAKLEYEEAFILSRKHRIDLNLIYDINPESFLHNVRLFCNQINNVDYLNLFISSLRNEDVTSTMYPGIGSSSVTKKSIDSKVNRICDAIRNTLDSIDPEKFFQPLLTAFVKKQPPDLEGALLRIKKKREISSELAENALKYIVFLVDVDHLYDVALGMYDFGLVLAVAQKSQKDPREYLPFLNQLRNLEKWNQRFCIDDHLKRYSKALKNLSLAGEHFSEKVLDYMCQHELYIDAIDIYKNNGPMIKLVYEKYGDFLKRNSQHKEAAIAYILGGAVDKAILSYQDAIMWREAISAAIEKYGKGEDSLLLSAQLAKILQQNQNFQDAATIHLEYLDDINGAVEMLVKGKLWSEAIRIVKSKGRKDLMYPLVFRGIQEGSETLLEEIKEARMKFEEDADRLKEVRNEKKNLKEKMESGEYTHNEALDNVDMFSEVTSVATRHTLFSVANSRMSSFSSRTGRTSKTRRKAERKRLSGKKGSTFEEEYLVRVLHKLISERFVHIRDEVNDILPHLCTFQLFSEAQEIQKEFSLFSDIVQKQMKFIFEKPEPSEDDLMKAGGILSHLGVQDATAFYMDSPKLGSVQWSLGMLKLR